jgi:hypothetical protein
MTTASLLKSELWFEFETIAKAKKRKPDDVLTEIINDYVTSAKSSMRVVEMPTNQQVSDEDVLTVWADRKESAQEIAREIRQRNRQIT